MNKSIKKIEIFSNQQTIFLFYSTDAKNEQKDNSIDGIGQSVGGINT